MWIPGISRWGRWEGAARLCRTFSASQERGGVSSNVAHGTLPAVRYYSHVRVHFALGSGWVWAKPKPTPVPTHPWPFSDRRKVVEHLQEWL
jgi:hypothetical protein